MKRNSIPAGRAASLAVIVLLLGSILLGPGRIDAFPTMGKNCSSCHAGGASGSVETRDASGAARTAFSAEPSGRVTVVVIGNGLPDSGAFVALVMGNSYDIVESFEGASGSPDPGTLYVGNNDANDLESGTGTIKASINLTIKSTAAEGAHACEAILGYSGPEGVRQSQQVTITVAAAQTDTPPVFGAVDFPAFVPLDTPIRVSCPLADDGGVTSVVLSYKGTGSTRYDTVDSELASGNPRSGLWEANIPAQTVPGTVYFNLNATDGKSFVSSPGGPGAKDYAVLVLAPGNPQIAHQPVPTAYIGSETVILANVTDAGNGVRLFYKEVGDLAFSSMPMNRSTGDGPGPSEYRSVIPAQTRKGQMSYYINATNGTTTISTPVYLIEVVSLWEPELVHVPVTSAYTGIDTVIAASAKNAAALTLWYKGVGDYTFRSRPMDRVGVFANAFQNYSAVLPAGGAPGSLSYYLNATNGTLFNSTKVFSVQVVEAVDLVLLKVSFSKRSPAAHEELIIKARIWNNSTRNLTGFQMSFFDDYYPAGDARYIGLVSNLTIPGNGTIDVRVWWLPQVNGTHHIRVKVDSTSVIKEVDESNNELGIDLGVRKAAVQGSPFFPTTEELLAFWPVLAVAAGILLGTAAHLFRRRAPVR